mgnify:CR=1 FL=1|tara:strand:+ start:45 stop:251 length:207 start_codon:yes stop_codon:yes gene_type:complete
MSKLQDYYEKETRPYHDPGWWTVWKNFILKVGGWALILGLLFLVFKSAAESNTARKILGFLSRVEVTD